MATNEIKVKGQAKATKPDAGGGVIRSVPVLGVVKNNIDSTRAGRIDVYIADFGAPNPNDKILIINYYFSTYFIFIACPANSIQKYRNFRSHIDLLIKELILKIKYIILIHIKMSFL